MNERIQGILERCRGGLLRLERWLDGRRVLAGALLAALLSGALALFNVGAGPLGNLHDIGGWANRALFIALTAAVHFAALLACAGLSRVRFSRVMLREAIVTAGLYIALLAINQKTYAYVNAVQPIVRAMDEGGLAAGLATQSFLSAPAIALLYVITRGPVYDMYLVKLFCVGCLLLLAVLAMHHADRRGLGIRAEALLTLALILPQGFLSAACAAQIEVAAVLLLALSLTLAREGRQTACALCFGAAAAVSGAALYALPVYALLWSEKRLSARRFALCLVPVAALLLPAIFAGMSPAAAAGSLLRANVQAPVYAGGAPGWLGLLPRAEVGEMPGYFMLRRLPAIDEATYAQEFYTQRHFEIAALGLTFGALAAYLGVAAVLARARSWSPLRRGLALALAGLLACPAATAGAWLMAAVLCVFALVAEPELRLPACLVLFATAGEAALPVTQETLLPTAAAVALCTLALCMLLDIVPMSAVSKSVTLKEEVRRDG